MQEEVSDFTDALCQNKCDFFQVTPPISFFRLYRSLTQL
ncbi:hypothetical protein WALBB_740029 [Wolbachia pipientis wAlbB]|nr:hypothetical protein WALBB_740029 [Wolbachia pipientis wAlbB]